MFNVFIDLFSLYVFYLFSGSDQEGKRQLAVLHPMKLSVYTLNTIEGNAEHGGLLTN